MGVSNGWAGLRIETEARAGKAIDGVGGMGRMGHIRSSFGKAFGSGAFEVLGSMVNTKKERVALSLPQGWENDITPPLQKRKARYNVPQGGRGSSHLR
ncbi:hypothetical protein MGG_18025 [Pyricularia oryzae 70-15]|uniref:Uncharacterized protein n=3 Tax=Pyricularia oryzae TaxID=318829 RepID=G5EHU8_PYRO7|nr:uncharacterized protein MGG_18025 [Pyricularia oryzae 70-15]EAQ70881.1 hypothetical protein MGCH7_ch7g288 [Pyricularia oryzae 70-15]EHA46483.1 hypothetical protein MGG_18025 [Pyricularia oryzae 70-15]ELQ40700.1 hypothetical protein OOU_Y34scaffold00378g12 [Pyricularia oryzae Y34]